ncbi:TPR-like protein [Hymenopellis radicata]|nr:TPR-like protein [Hymenopellis radicata]
MSEAEKLKAEGNTLYAKKDYASAIVKYTKAIAVDDKNAILYSNRSACQRFLKRYTSDSATELDPTYAKAWGRVGDVSNILGEYTRSVAAYKKALGCLPTENLSPAEAKQKAQYEEGMKLSQDVLDRPPIEVLEVNPRAQQINKTAGDKPPWIVAQEMMPDLLRNEVVDTVVCLTSRV